MGTKLTKRAYIKLINDDLTYLNNCPDNLEKEHIKAILCNSIDLLYPVQLKDIKHKRKCPYCGSTNVIMFDSNNDLCNKCERYFPGS